MEGRRMPKNVRQIGQAVQGREVYIEDYVITFARKQAKKKAEPQLAILLGRERTSRTEPLFISGAVLVEDFHMETSLLLSNENWSQIYEGIKKFFADLEIVGCLFMQNAMGEEINERLRRLHKENFGEGQEVLLLYHGEEQREGVYLATGGVLLKQEGFFIYYEKNEAMQEYMIEKSDSVKETVIFDDRAVKKVREAVASKNKGHSRTPEQSVRHISERTPMRTSERRLMQLMYGASTVLAATVLVIGVTMLDSRDKMQDMETTLNTISNKVSVAAEATEKPVIVETLAGNTTQAKDETDETTDGRDDTENTDTSTKTDGEEKMTEGTKETEADKKETEGTKETEEAKEAEADKKEPEETKDTKDEEKTTEVAREVTYYTVQNGDTLATISLEKYHTLDMIDQIQKLNAIDDKDKIYAGEKILLP